MLSSDEMRIK